MLEERQLFLRPYAEDIIKEILISFPGVKVLLAADLPRPTLVKLVREMASTVKLSFLGPRPISLNPNQKCVIKGKASKFYEIIDSSLYVNGQIDFQELFGRQFLNNKDQIIFFGNPNSVNI